MQQNNNEHEMPASEAEYVDNPDDWDWENAVVVEGKRPARANFSVRFESGEFTQVALAAEAAGMKTGEFIRNAALAAARGETHTDPTSALIALATKCGMRVTFEPVQAPVTAQLAGGDSEAA
jgi:hypothetical protein